MKKWLLILLLLPLAVGANDIRTVCYDTVAIADTVAANVDRDTFYTVPVDIRDYCHLALYWKTMRFHGLPMFNSGGSDSMIFQFQTSYDKRFTNPRTYAALDQSATVAGGDSGYVLSSIPSCTDTVIGNWGRGMLILHDSTEGDQPDSVGNIRGFEFIVWLLTRK